MYLKNILTHVFQMNKSPYFLKLLVLILIITNIPCFIIASGIYFFGTSYIYTIVNIYHEQQFKQLSEEINDFFNLAEISCSRTAYNPVFDNRLRKIGIDYDPGHINDIYKVLFSIKDANPYIDDIYLYIDSQEMLITEHTGITVMDYSKQITQYKLVFAHSEHLYWTDSLSKMNQYKHPGQIALVQKLPLGSYKPAGALIIFIDHNRVSNIINKMTSHGQGAAFLLNDQGRLMGVNYLQDQTPPLEKDVSEIVQSREAGTETFSHSFDRKIYSVSYHRFNRLGNKWTFVVAIPVEKLAEPVKFISRLIVFISLIGLMVAMFMSLLASRRVYFPFQKILNMLDIGKVNGKNKNEDEIEMIIKKWVKVSGENKILQDMANQNMQRIREGFLLQLIQGRLGDLSDSDLTYRMKQLEWDTEGKTFTCAAIRVNDFTTGDSKFINGDEQLVTFAVYNVLSEILPAWFHQGEVIIYRELLVAIILIYDDAEEFYDKIEKMSLETIRIIKEALNLDILFFIGEGYKNLSETSIKIEELVRYSGFRRFNEERCVYHMEELSSMKEGTLYYPFSLEDKVIDHIMKGEEEQAVESVYQFIAEVRKKALNEFMLQQTVLQLLADVQFAMLKSGYTMTEYFNGLNRFEILSHLKDDQAMILWFEENVIKPLIRIVKKHTNEADIRVKTIVRGVIEIIQSEYASDISLESCADRYDISAFLLSRIFKQVTGMNFIDYLTKVRLDHSKKLLTGTGMTINDIALKVGYQGTYFNRIFKKHEGISPSRYREVYTDEKK